MFTNKITVIVNINLLKYANKFVIIIKKTYWLIRIELDFYNHKSISSSCFERLNSHIGAEKHPTVGSSGEYWSMNESLNQRFVGMIDS